MSFELLFLTKLTELAEMLNDELGMDEIDTEDVEGFCERTIDAFTAIQTLATTQLWSSEGVDRENYKLRLLAQADDACSAANAQLGRCAAVHVAQAQACATCTSTVASAELAALHARNSAAKAAQQALEAHGENEEAVQAVGAQLAALRTYKQRAQAQ